MPSRRSARSSSHRLSDVCSLGFRYMMLVGIDLGGSKLLGGVLDGGGRVRARLRSETAAYRGSLDAGERQILDGVTELQWVGEIDAVGVGVAGFVDRDGSVVFAPHLPWRDTPLQQVLADRLGIPVFVDNDANMTARAEARFGAGRGCQSALVLTMGTGIGGALLCGDEVVRGAHGLAGEFGHMQVVPQGLPCECGQTGCWEQYASGRVIARFGAAHGNLGGTAVTDAARAGERWAREAFDEVGRWLGVGLAGLVASFDPEIIIIGGGLSEAGDLLLDPAREALSLRLPGRGYRGEPLLVSAELGPEAGFIGAADLAHTMLRKSSNAD